VSADGFRGNPRTTIAQAKRVLEEDFLGEGFLDDWIGVREAGPEPFIVDVVFTREGRSPIMLSRCWLEDSGALDQYGTNYGRLTL
jgi:hypothetical protein